MQFVTEKWPILLKLHFDILIKGAAKLAKQHMDQAVQSAPPPFLDFLAADVMFRSCSAAWKSNMAG